LGTKFFLRIEIKDILSYARLALNPESMADMKRIINTPARGIGKVGLLKILEGKESDLPAGTRIKFLEFRNILASIKKKIENEKPSEAIKYILTASGIEKMLKEGKEADDERLENARELVTLATKYDLIASEPVTIPELDVEQDFGSILNETQNFADNLTKADPTSKTYGMEKLLEEASLASDQDSLEKNENAVKLMTVHASKGLEFDNVFITGLEQELFPHSRSEDSGMSPEEEEEERRLFYVALTRARKKLYLCYSSVRTIFGSKQVNLPSEFISDIDSVLIEQSERPTGIKSIFIDF
jgi:DNA helicase-2/ATP-dependent DNA helicase PcrA